MRCNQKSELVGMILIVLLAGSSLGQTISTNILGRWANGPCYAVDVSGTTAYFGNGGYMEIMDISDPANPIELGKILTPSVVLGITVSGSFAYVSDFKSGLIIIDISDPTNPVEIGSFDTDEYAYQTAVSGNYVYLLGALVFRIIDVSNPANPEEVGQYTPAGITEFRDISVQGNYAYLLDMGGVAIFDISDVTNPVYVNSLYSGAAFPTSFDVVGNNVFVGDEEGNLWISDISDPQHPDSLSHYYLGEGWENSCLGLSVSSQSIFARTAGGMQIIDISDISNPLQLSSTQLSIEYWSFLTRGVIVSQNHVYVASEYDGLGRIDITDPANPEELDCVETGGYAQNVIVGGDFALLQEGDPGLRIIDVSTATDPVDIGFLDGYYHWQGTVNGNYAYLHYDGAFQIIEVSNPSDPTQVGNIVHSNTSYNVQELAVVGNHLYLTCVDSSLQIVDISNPSDPTLISSLDVGDYADAISLFNGYVYLGGDSGVRIIDISSPITPLEVGILDLPGFVQKIISTNNTAYIFSYLDYLGTVHIFDVTNPASPETLGSFPLPFGDWTVKDDYVYTVNTIDGSLAITDISDLENISQPSFFNFGGYVWGITSDDEYVYLADGDDGLYILEAEPLPTSTEQVNPPKRWELIQNYPNPFNPSTTIQYDLPAQSHVNLTIFDIQGREIQTLVDDPQAAGQYQIQWGGIDKLGKQVSSGMYLCRINAGSFTETIKMVYLQ